MTGISFKIWLEFKEKDFEFYKNLVLGKLDLDGVEGLSATLNTWKPEALQQILQGLGEFKALPESVQKQVFGKIQSGSGTLADIIRIMASQAQEITP